MSTRDALPPDDPLRTYIEKVLELTHRRDGQPDDAPSPGDLEAVAKELGLSGADRKRLEQAAADALARGLGFLEHGRPRDAVEELETAAALRPHDVETLHALAAARGALSIETGSAEEDAAARALVRRTLALDPRHKPSFELLNRLDAAKKRGPSVGPGRPAGSSKRIGKIAAVLVVLGVIVVALMLVRRPPAPANASDGSASADEAEAPATEPGDTPPERLFPVSAPPSMAVAGDGRIDATYTLDESFDGKGVGLDVKAAWFNRYPERTYYNAWLLLKNDTGSVVSELKAKTEYLDASGKVLAAQNHFPVISIAEPLQPGDTVPVRVIKEVAPEVVAARMHLEKLTTREVAPREAAKAVELEWPVAKPADVDVEVRERWVELSENTLKGGFWHKIVLELHNKSAKPLRALNINVQRFDGGGQLQQADAVNAAWEVPLFPGEVRVIKSLETLTVPVKKYHLQVTGVTVGAERE